MYVLYYVVICHKYYFVSIVIHTHTHIGSNLYKEYHAHIHNVSCYNKYVNKLYLSDYVTYIKPI